MTDTQHTHSDTANWVDDCPKCRKQRYGNAERTSLAENDVATTMTTTAALDDTGSSSSDTGASSSCDTSSSSSASDSGASAGCDGGAG